jgi:hypothetical protein
MRTKQGMESNKQVSSKRAMHQVLKYDPEYNKVSIIWGKPPESFE